MTTDDHFEKQLAEYKRERSVLFRDAAGRAIDNLDGEPPVTLGHSKSTKVDYCMFRGEIKHVTGTYPLVCVLCKKYNEREEARSSTDHPYANVGRAKTEPEDQPMPVVNDLPFVHDQVAQDVAARGELGKRRYGTKLQPFNGRNALQDVYEELLDAAVYIKQRIIEEEATGAETED